MAQIDPNTVQWDAPPQPVGKPVTGAKDQPLQGGVILPGKPKEVQQPSPLRETEKWRTMTPQEVAATPGLDPTKTYQINAAGKIEPIGGAAATPKVEPKTAAANLLLSAGVDPTTGLDPVSALIEGSTSGAVENWFANAYGAVTGEATSGMENIAKLKTIVSDMTLQLTGGSLGAGVSNADVTFLKERVGNLADPTRPANERLAAWNEVKSRLQRITGATPPAPTPDAGGGTTPPAVAPIKAGEAFQTEADLAAQRQLQDAWARGLSVDELIQFNQQIGRGAFSPEDIQRMRDARAQNKPEAIRFYATPTGQPTAAQGIIGAALETPVGEAVGGYAMGAARGLTAETLDELAPIIGLSAEQVRAAQNYLEQKAGTATALGQITGAVAGSIPAIRGAQAGLAGTRLAGAAPLIAETAFGAATGAGAADEGNRALGALIGGGAALGGGALANRFLPGGPGTFTGIVPEAPAAGRFAGEAVPPQQIIEGGREAGIPIMTSDIRPPETFMGRIGQQVGEIVPLGTAGMRRTQQESREQAVETLLADAGVTIDRDIARDLVTDLTEKRGADLTKFTTMKREVIERLAGAGDVPATKSLDAIDNLIGKLEAENLPRQLGPLIQQLQDAKTSLSGPGNLNKIEANRATLFDLKSDPGLANIATKTEKAWDAVYRALNDDMGDFIKANGDIRDFNRWKVANTKLAMMAGELRQGGLKRVLDKGDFDPTTVSKMLTSSNPQEARLLFTNLGKDGRANARLLLLQNAAQKAFDPNTGVVNPNTFAREVGRLKSNFGQFFGGAEAKRINGLVAALNATRRAQEAQFAPRTGERLLPFATAGSFGWGGTLLGFDPATGLASSAAFGAARRLYESAPVRDLLLKIGNATGSEKARLVADLTQRISAASATTGAAQTVSPEPGAPEGAIMVRPQQ